MSGSVWIIYLSRCDQFRKAIIKSLFDVVDVRRASQTKPRAERMRIFKKWYLTGLEPTAERTLPQKGTYVSMLGDALTDHY